MDIFKSNQLIAFLHECKFNSSCPFKRSWIESFITDLRKDMYETIFNSKSFQALIQSDSTFVSLVFEMKKMGGGDIQDIKQFLEEKNVQ